MNASMSRLSLAASAVLLVAGPLRADTIAVPADFATIQEAVDAAVAGDTVKVSKGYYSENVVVSTSGITLKGSTSVIINGGYHDNCITVNANDVTIDSFTLENGGEPFTQDGNP